MIERRLQLAIGRSQLQARGRAWPFSGLANDRPWTFAAADMLSPVPRAGDVAELEGLAEWVAELGGGQWPRSANEGLMMLTRQNFRIDKGQVKRLRFRVRNGAGITAAAWYCAKDRNAIMADHDLDLTSGAGGISITPDGDDAIVLVTISAAQSETSLKAGARFHQLWVSDSGGEPVPVAEGTATVLDSLRN